MFQCKIHINGLAGFPTLHKQSKPQISYFVGLSNSTLTFHLTELWPIFVALILIDGQSETDLEILAYPSHKY